MHKRQAPCIRRDCGRTSQPQVSPIGPRAPASRAGPAAHVSFTPRIQASRRVPGLKPVDYAQFQEELATVSGEAILPFFRTALGADDKSLGGVFDPVTEADRAAEAVMRRMINAAFPPPPPMRPTAAPVALPQGLKCVILI
jgi:hypothetical protein